MFYNVKKGTDRLTDWHTDGSWVQYLSEYVYNVKKATLKIWGKSFLKMCQIIFSFKCLSPMEKGCIVFAISFLEPRGNSEQNGYVQILFYINSICVFSKAI